MRQRRHFPDQFRAYLYVFGIKFTLQLDCKNNLSLWAADKCTDRIRKKTVKPLPSMSNMVDRSLRTSVTPIHHLGMIPRPFPSFKGATLARAVLPAQRVLARLHLLTGSSLRVNTVVTKCFCTCKFDNEHIDNADIYS